MAFVAEVNSGNPGRYVATMRRRTAVLHRFQLEPGQPDLLVKVFFSHTEAAKAFAALGRLADAVGSGLSEVSCVRPIALATTLPAFAMPYVAGSTMRQVMMRAPERAGFILARAGRALARLHSLSSVDPAESQEVALAFRTQTLEGSYVSRASTMARFGPLVHRNADFHPHNLFLLDGESVLIIDAPSRDEVTYIHHDMANFIYKAQKALATSPWSRRRAGCLFDFASPVSAFLTNYFTSAGRTIGSGDLEMIDRYLRVYASMRPRPSHRTMDLVYSVGLTPLLRRQVRIAGHRAAICA